MNAPLAQRLAPSNSPDADHSTASRSIGQVPDPAASQTSPKVRRTINGQEWRMLMPLLEKPSSIAGLAAATKLPEEVVAEVVKAHCDQLRPSTVSGPAGELLLVNKNSLKSRLWELAHIFKLAAR